MYDRGYSVKLYDILTGTEDICHQKQKTFMTYYNLVKQFVTHMNDFENQEKSFFLVSTFRPLLLTLGSLYPKTWTFNLEICWPTLIPNAFLITQCWLFLAIMVTSWQVMELSGTRSGRKDKSNFFRVCLSAEKIKFVCKPVSLCQRPLG